MSLYSKEKVRKNECEALRALEVKLGEDIKPTDNSDLVHSYDVYN